MHEHRAAQSAVDRSSPHYIRRLVEPIQLWPTWEQAWYGWATTNGPEKAHLGSSWRNLPFGNVGKQVPHERIGSCKLGDTRICVQCGSLELLVWSKEQVVLADSCGEEAMESTHLPQGTACFDGKEDSHGRHHGEAEKVEQRKCCKF